MISAKKIRELLRRLPDFSGPSKIYIPIQGESTIVFKIVTRVGEVCFLRIPKDKNESVLPEVTVYNRLHKLKVKIPLVYAYQDFSPTLNSRSFILCSSIKGKSCDSLKINCLNNSFLSMAAKDLFKINSIEGSGFGSIHNAKISKGGRFIAKFSTYREFITDRIKENINVLSKSNLFSHDEMDNIKKVIDSKMTKAHLLNISKGYLAHGDYHPGHIFCGNSTYSGLIDFGDAKIAPKGYDLSYLKIKNRTFFDQFEGKYRLIEGSSIPKKDFQALTFLVGIRIISSECRLNKIKNKENGQVQSFKRELMELSADL